MPRLLLRLIVVSIALAAGAVGVLASGDPALAAGTCPGNSTISGSFSGSSDNDGLHREWNGSATFREDPDYDCDGTHWTLVSGGGSWSESGTDLIGCAHSGSGGGAFTSETAEERVTLLDTNYDIVLSSTGKDGEVHVTCPTDDGPLELAPQEDDDFTWIGGLEATPWSGGETQLNGAGTNGASTYKWSFAIANRCKCGTQMSAEGRKQLMKSEKLVKRVYEDSEHFCTVGYGHLVRYSPCTAADKKTWNNKPKSFYENLFATDLKHYEKPLNKLIASKPWLTYRLTQCQYDALVDVMFNAGVGTVTTPYLPLVKTKKGKPKDVKRPNAIYFDLVQDNIDAIPEAITSEDWGSQMRRDRREKRTPATIHGLAVRRAAEVKEFTMSCHCGRQH